MCEGVSTVQQLDCWQCLLRFILSLKCKWAIIIHCMLFDLRLQIQLQGFSRAREKFWIFSRKFEMQIAHPNFITWHWFLRYCSHTERLFQYCYPNPNIDRHPNPNPDPNPNPNPNPSHRERNIRFTGLSRDQISFLPITSQGSIFTLRHVGWFGISEQKYVDSSLQEITRTCLQKI